MKTYKHKQRDVFIEAEEMTYGEYEKVNYKTYDVNDKSDYTCAGYKENDNGYLVKNTLHKFITWFPKDKFESSYIAKDKSTFGEAIKAIKDGRKAKREGWNGKNQYIQLATCISYKAADGTIVNCEHDAIGNKAIAFVGTSGVQMGWLASQSDMLAEDWIIFD